MCFANPTKFKTFHLKQDHENKPNKSYFFFNFILISINYLSKIIFIFANNLMDVKVIFKDFIIILTF